MTADAPLEKLREICLGLPDTEEVVSWGHPSFKVAGKVFPVYEEIDGRWTVGVKLEPPHAELLAAEPEVVKTHDFGKLTWVLIDAARIDDWRGISDLVMESYNFLRAEAYSG